MITYRKTSQEYDELPEPKIFDYEGKKEAAKTLILNYINSGKKTFTELRDYFLVERNFASTHHAKGADLKKLLDEMVNIDNTLQFTSRPDQLFIEPAGDD